MEERVEVDRSVRTTAGASEETEAFRGCFDGPPKEVLRRLSQDAHPIIELVIERIRAHGFLLEPQHLVPRSMAWMAYRAAEASEAPKLGLWMVDCIDDAIDDSLQRDRADVAAGILALDEGADPRTPFVVSLVGIEPGLALEAVVRFNSLPMNMRRAFREVFVEMRSMDDCVEDGVAEDRESVAALIQEAMKAFRTESDGEGNTSGTGSEERGE